MPDVDYGSWLTKQQAAEAIGVTTKTVEQLAKDRKLEQAFWRRPTGGPLLAVYNPDDVGRIALERHQAPAPFVLPAIAAAAGNGNGRPSTPGPTQALARTVGRRRRRARARLPARLAARRHRAGDF